MVAVALLSGALFASAAFAAAPNASFPDSAVSPLLTSIPATQRNSWCTSQKSVCGSLCGGQTETGHNLCDGSTLNFTCTCSSNNSAPALEYYVGTIPTYECQTLNGNCIAANAGDLSGQQNCNATYVCGTLDSKDAAAAQTSAAASSSAAPTATGASQTTTASTAATSTAAAVALRLGEQYGAGILGAGLLAIMGAVL
ncbi:MAG: hypothetical protein MMC23_004507 [Stictis urceolatum]|nr:hypothetical protein [Stictis urceolata]